MTPCLVAAREPRVVCWRPHLAGTQQYTVCVKRTAYLIPIFFVAPTGKGTKNSHGRLCKREFYPHLHNRLCEFLAPLPQGRTHGRTPCNFGRQSSIQTSPEISFLCSLEDSMFYSIARFFLSESNSYNNVTVAPIVSTVNTLCIEQTWSLGTE